MKRTHIIIAVGLVFGLSVSELFAQDDTGQDHFLGFGCASCHGAQGEGTVLAPSVAVGALSADEFISYVRQPTGSMPMYPVDTLSDAMLQEIYAFVTLDVRQQSLVGRTDIGGQVFRSKGCYQCHANEGQGGAQGPRLGPNPISFSRFSWYVRNTNGGMPPYTDVVLSDQDLADIYAFLEERLEPPSIRDIPMLAP
jgi:ubiquinol-cytochrome c reductase cytochrome c subunit